MLKNLSRIAAIGLVCALYSSGPVNAQEYLPVPFGITLTSPLGLEWPERGSIVSLHQARWLSDVAVFSLPWADAETGIENDCVEIAGAIEFAQRLGMQIMIRHEQFVGGDVFIPESIGTTLADQSVRLELLEQLSCFAALEPEYFVVSNELNLILFFNQPEYNILAAGFYSAMYDTVKNVSPNTSVGLSYMYDLIHQTDSWVAYDNIVGTQDFVGMTSYLGVDGTDDRFPTPTSVQSNYFDKIREHLGPLTRVVFTEYAWASNGSEGMTNQVEWLDRMNELLDPVRPEIVAWAALHDLQPSIQNPDHAETTTSGLREVDGTIKPSWHKVIEMLGDGSLRRFPNTQFIGR